MAWLYLIIGFLCGVCSIFFVIFLIALAASTPSKRTAFGTRNGKEGRTL